MTSINQAQSSPTDKSTTHAVQEGKPATPSPSENAMLSTVLAGSIAVAENILSSQLEKIAEEEEKQEEVQGQEHHTAITSEDDDENTGGSGGSSSGGSGQGFGTKSQETVQSLEKGKIVESQAIDSETADTQEILPGINQIGMSAAAQSYDFYTKTIQAYTDAQISYIDTMRFSSEMMVESALTAADEQRNAADLNAKITRNQAGQSFASAGGTLTGITAGAAAGYIKPANVKAAETSSMQQQQKLSQLEATKQALNAPPPKASDLKTQMEADSQDRQILQDSKTMDDGKTLEGDKIPERTDAVNTFKYAKTQESHVATAEKRTAFESLDTAKKGEAQTHKLALQNAQPILDDPALTEYATQNPGTPQGQTLKAWNDLSPEQRANAQLALDYDASAAAPSGTDSILDEMQNAEKLTAKQQLTGTSRVEVELMPATAPPAAGTGLVTGPGAAPDPKLTYKGILSETENLGTDPNVRKHQAVQLERDMATLKSGQPITDSKLTTPQKEVAIGARTERAQRSIDVEKITSRGLVDGDDPNTLAQTKKAVANMSPEEKKKALATVDKEIETTTKDLEKSQGVVSNFEHGFWQKMSMCQAIGTSTAQITTGILQMMEAELKEKEGEAQARLQLAQTNKEIYSGTYQSSRDQISSLNQSISSANQAMNALGNQRV